MEKITLIEAKKILLELKNVMQKNKESLIERDSVMGDGDLGLTMDKIFTKASDEMAQSSDAMLGKFFSKAGMIMAQTAKSY